MVDLSSLVAGFFEIKTRTAGRARRSCGWLLVAALLSGQPQLAAADPLPAREFKGAVELDAGRVLVWESVSDGSGEMPLWIFEDGRVPRQVGKVAAEQLAAATGAGTIVFVADQRLYVTSSSQPAQPVPVDLPGEWLSVAHGPMGFVIGGEGDLCAMSPDGKKWTPFEFKAPDEGGIAQLAWNGTELLALRQTSVLQDGWGINVSELCLSPDGKTWRRVAGFEGGNNGVPVEAIAWVGDRWLGHGLGALVELTPDGKSRRIAPTSGEGENALLAGNVAVFRDGARWLLTSTEGVAVSADLMDWKAMPKTGGGDVQGVWLAARDGAPRLVGSTKRDWTQKQVYTLAEVLNSPATAKAAPAPGRVEPGSEEYRKAGEAKKAGKMSEAVALWQAGAAKNHVWSMYALGQYYLDEKNSEAAYQWVTRGLTLSTEQKFAVGIIFGDDLLEAIAEEAVAPGAAQAAPAVTAKATPAVAAQAAPAPATKTAQVPALQLAGKVVTSTKPRGPDTVYDWPAIMAAAVKRAAAEPPREIHESIAKRRGTKTNKWSKGSPWTAADMLAAFQKGASATEVVQAMGVDYDGADLDLPGLLTVLTSPEWPELLKKSRSLFDRSGSMMKTDLWGLVQMRSNLANALAREVIARRQKEVGPVSKPVDSPELRRRAVSGEAEASYLLYLLHYGSRDEGDQTPIPDDLLPAEKLRAQATAGHAAAQWLLADQFENNSDKTRNDPVRVFELYWASAMAGDAIGAFKLAKRFAPPNNEYGVERNYAESEYWFIEAAVRGWPGQMERPYQRPWLELANLYSAQTTNDVLSTLMPTYEDATARWLRLLNDRGGVMADYAQLMIRYLDDESGRDPTPFNYAKRSARIPPEMPVLPAEEWRKIEASAAGRPADLLRVAAAYAGGRLVRQNDTKAVEFYRQAAAAGAGLPAYRALAHHYRNGYGVKKDLAQWLVWQKKAAETGDIVSLLELGDALHYHNQQGIAQDHAGAMVAYEKAAALGSGGALHAIGLMHRYGRGVPKDEKKWREFMERAAAEGSAEAMSGIAYSYINSDVKWDQKDHAQAAIWYRKAVEAGDRNSRFALAEALHNSQDAAGAEKWLRELAAEYPEHVEARYKLAQMTERDGRRDEAVRWYREVAELDTIHTLMKDNARQFVREYDEEEAAKPGTLPYYRKKAKTGTSDDMFDYAMRVAPSHRAQAGGWLNSAAYEGHAPATAVAYEWKAQQDKAAAEQWIRELAEKGNAQAGLILGLLTAATDKPAGLALIQRAADAGNADAIFRVGMMQYNGNELPQDRAAGLAQMTKAADAGFPLAQFTLGRALLKGEVGLPADPQRAVGYLKRAMANNYAGPVALQAAVLLGQIYESGQISGIKADLGAAVEAYERATKLDPRNTKLLNHSHEVQRRMAQQMKISGGR